MPTPRVCHDIVIPEEMCRDVDRFEPASLRGDNNRWRLAMDPKRTWPPGKSLQCQFLHGSDAACKKVARFAREWCRHASISFSFSCDDGYRSDFPQIRIAFMPGSSWSAVGTDSLNIQYFPRHQPTMNFGWLDDEAPESEWRRVVLHEFGHALGCIHEHQQPRFDRVWNKDEVYRQFAGFPNFWSREVVDRNIIDHYGREIKATVFDPDSIMLYMFDGSLFSDGRGGTKENSQLSPLDIEMVKKMYPS